MTGQRLRTDDPRVYLHSALRIVMDGRRTHRVVFISTSEARDGRASSSGESVPGIRAVLYVRPWS
jgi:hypothetical protein